MTQDRPTSRRRFIIAGAAVAGAAGAAAFLLLDDDPEPVEKAGLEPLTPGAEPRFAQETEVAEGDMALGDPDAPVTVIEYASMTCSHCATFHADTFPALKEKYIDTGRVRFVFREFPLDQLALRASMLARCAGEDRFFGFVDMMMSQQAAWAGSQQPMQALERIAKLGGMDSETFNACMTNEALLNEIVERRYDGQEKYDVASTPTFIVDGEKYAGALRIDEFDRILEPLLKGV